MVFLANVLSCLFIPSSCYKRPNLIITSDRKVIIDIFDQQSLKMEIKNI